MKKKFICLFTFYFLFWMSSFAEAPLNVPPTQEPSARYRVFSTQNVWTFLELDTRTGMVWQFQYGMNDVKSGGVEISTENLAKGKTEKDGRFTLYPTSNMWTFLLVDQIDGIVWQVQWSNEADYRFVKRIF